MPALLIGRLEFTVVLGPIIEPLVKEKKEKKNSQKSLPVSKRVVLLQPLTETAKRGRIEIKNDTFIDILD